MDKLHEILRGGDMKKEKGVMIHKAENFVEKAKEKLTPEEPVREAVKPEPVRRETVRLGVDNHLIDSYEFDLGDEKFLVQSVNRGGSEVPKAREEEIKRAAKQRGYALAEVE